MLSIFILFLCLIIMTIAFYGFYLLSEKQIKKTEHSIFSHLALHRSTYKKFCFVLCVLSAIGLMYIYGISIGAVTWWILATPLLLMIILWVNPLKKPPK